MDQSLPPIVSSSSSSGVSSDVRVGDRPLALHSHTHSHTHSSTRTDSLPSAVSKPLTRHSHTHTHTTNNTSTSSSGGVLQYISPQLELFSHYEAPHTHSRTHSPAFSCGQAKPPDDTYILSPRGDHKPEHRPYSASFSAPFTVKYDDYFVLNPSDKPVDTRPHSPAFLSGVISNPAKDDIFVLSPRNEKIEQPIVSNMRCSVSPQYNDTYMLEPNGPVATTFRPHSPAFLSGVISNPAKDDYFVLSPRDLSRLKEEQNRPTGPPMHIGGELQHHDAFMLEPSPPTVLTREHSSAFLAGTTPAPSDEFVLSPTLHAKADARSSDMRVGGNLSHNDVFFDKDTYRNPVPLSTRPAGGMTTKGHNSVDMNPSPIISVEPYKPPVGEGRHGGSFSAGAIQRDNTIPNYTPNVYPIPDKRKLSTHTAAKMNVGPIHRTGEFEYVSEPERERELESTLRGMNMGGLSRTSDPYMHTSDVSHSTPTYDRSTPHFSHAKLKKRSPVNTQPPVQKGGMRISVTVPHKDDFVITEGGPVIDKARQGSSMRTRGTLNTDDTMEKYESHGPAPVPTGKSDPRGMKVGISVANNDDVFALNGGVAGVDRGRTGGGLRTSGKPNIEDSMDRYESHGPGAEVATREPGNTKGMTISKSISHPNDTFDLAPADTRVKYTKNSSGFCTGGRAKTDDTMDKYECQTGDQQPRQKIPPAGIKVGVSVPHKDDFVITEGGPVIDKARQGSSMRTRGTLNTDDTMEKYESHGPAPVPTGKSDPRGMKVGISVANNDDVFALNGGVAGVDRGRTGGGLRTSGKPNVEDSMDRYECHGPGAEVATREPGNTKGMAISKSISHPNDTFALSPDVREVPFVRPDLQKQPSNSDKYVPRPSLLTSKSENYISPYKQKVSRTHEVPENELRHDDNMKTYGQMKRKDVYFGNYEELPKEAKEIRPHSLSFVAGPLNREKDAIFLEPTLHPVTQISREFSQPMNTYGQHNQDVFVLKYDENGGKSSSLNRAYSTPCKVTSTINRDDKYFLEPNKQGQNITRSATVAFSAGVARQDPDIYPIKYESPPKDNVEETQFFVRHHDATNDLQYDLEYYDPVTHEGPSELTVFNTYGPIGRNDEYCNKYEEVLPAMKTLRPHSLSFVAGSLDREKDALFLEPTLYPVTHISREFSQPMSSYGQHNDDIFVLKYDENAAKPTVNQRPYSSPYTVTSTVERNDSFFLEPNKTTHNITRSSGTKLTKGNFVAGSKRLRREDSFFREEYKEKPSLCRAHSSSFLTSRPTPKDVYITEPIEKPQMRPATVDDKTMSSRKGGGARGSSTKFVESEEQIKKMLSVILVDNNVPAIDQSCRNDTSESNGTLLMEHSFPTAENIIGTADKVIEESGSNVPVKENVGEGSTPCPETDNGGGPAGEKDKDNDDESVSSCSTMHNLKMSVLQQREEWLTKVAPIASGMTLSSKTSPIRKIPPKLKPRTQKDKKLAMERMKALKRKEKRNEALAGKVKNLLSSIVEQNGKT